ncbi:hypothetical protein D3C72_1411280 [compost metagenome]
MDQPIGIGKPQRSRRDSTRCVRCHGGSNPVDGSKQFGPTRLVEMRDKRAWGRRPRTGSMGAAGYPARSPHWRCILHKRLPTKV